MTGFTSETGSIAGKKSGESRRKSAPLRKAQRRGYRIAADGIVAALVAETRANGLQPVTVTVSPDGKITVASPQQSAPAA